MPSIRWQLPLSYALIAFLATLTLGAVQLTVLRDHYARQERVFLENNAFAISEAVGQMWVAGIPSQEFSKRVNFLAMLPQTRVVVQNTEGDIVVDSGEPAGAFDIRLDEMAFPIAPGEPATPITIYMNEEAPQPERIFLAQTDDEMITIRGNHNVVRVSTTPFGPLFMASPTMYAGERISQEDVMVRLENAQGESLGSVRVSGGPAFGADILESVTRGWIISCIVAVVLAALVGWWISHRITSPLISLTDTTQKMAAGDLTVRSDVLRRDELGVLASSFNEMASRIETSFNTLRRFVADAAHEICTPLTALRTNLELIGEKSGADVHQALIQVSQLETLTRDLLDLSRIEAASTGNTLEAVDVLDLIDNVSQLYASRAEQADLDFRLNVPPHTPIVMGNPAQLRRMVCNLLDNAIKFTPAGGTVAVTLRITDQQLELMVQDTGIGIPNGDLPYLFERFRRGSNTSSYPGSGLGLAIVKAIAAAHHASLSAESSTGGTTIKAVFPVMS